MLQDSQRKSDFQLALKDLNDPQHKARLKQLVLELSNGIQQAPCQHSNQGQASTQIEPSISP